MTTDIRTDASGEVPDADRGLVRKPSSSRRWALAEDADAVRVVLWGEVGPRATAALDARLITLPAHSAPLVVDLTGVTELHEETVTWLGLRHAEFGRERPMTVCVVADGRVHRRLTRPDAPRLRLALE